MMIFIANTLVVFLATLCAFRYKSFMGSSSTMYEICGLYSTISILASIVFLIWSFWLLPWWQPIVIFIIGGFLGGFFSRDVQRSLAWAISLLILTPISIIACFLIMLRA